MAWMSDEQYELYQDIKEKKVTARSARHTRTHCGKGGPVKFPSDYKTKKELEAMNGECKSYRLNDPMSWEEFKAMPEDLKIDYIKLIRQKYNAPDSAIAKYVFETSHWIFGKWVRSVGLGLGKASGGNGREWDKKGFMEWCGKTSIEEIDIPVNDDIPVDEEIPVEEQPLPPIEECLCTEEREHVDQMCKEIMDIINEKTSTDVAENSDEKPAICTVHYMPVIPKSGMMTFEYNHADDALATIKCLLSDAKVNITVSWECVKE